MSNPESAFPIRLLHQRFSMVFAAGIAAAMLGACSSSQESLRTPRQPSPDTTSVAIDTTTAPEPESTLGEQLGRLDARMKTAPLDSLPYLRAEYERLLGAATSGDDIQTGEPDERSIDGDMVTIDTIPLDASATLAGPNGMVGFRPGELRSTSRRRANRRVVRTEQPTPLVEDDVSEADAAMQRDSRYVDGMVAEQSGRSEDAVRELPAVVASPPPGKAAAANAAYAQALEKSGNTKKATEQYRKAASVDDSETAHKSYVSYCRMLASSGQRTKARQLLVQFIGSHPKSPQVVTARRLLQTL